MYLFLLEQTWHVDVMAATLFTQASQTLRSMLCKVTVHKTVSTDPSHLPVYLGCRYFNCIHKHLGFIYTGLYVLAFQCTIGNQHIYTIRLVNRRTNKGKLPGVFLFVHAGLLPSVEGTLKGFC